MCQGSSFIGSDTSAHNLSPDPLVTPHIPTRLLQGMMLDRTKGSAQIPLVPAYGPISAHYKFRPLRQPPPPLAPFDIRSILQAFASDKISRKNRLELSGVVVSCGSRVSTQNHRIAKGRDTHTTTATGCQSPWSFGVYFCQRDLL